MNNTTGDDDDGQPSSVLALARMHSRRGIACTLGVLQTRASPLSAAHMAGLFRYKSLGLTSVSRRMSL